MGKLRISDGIDVHYGSITAKGGIDGLDLSNGISGSNFNISGVNALTFNDPGEGINFAGSAAVNLYAIDDATDSIMNFSSATEIRRNNNKMWDAGNDGSNSGLDADLLDGRDTSDSGGANRVIITNSSGDTSLGSGRLVTGGLYGTGHSSSILPIWQYNSANPGYGIGYYEGNPDTIRFDASSNLMSGTPDFEVSSNIAKVNGNVVWHAGNDGPSSGLNADFLDNLHASNFMRLDASADVTNYSHVHSFYTNGNIATSSGSQSSLQCYNGTVGNDAFMTFHVGSDFACYFGLDGGTNKLSVGGWSMGANSYEIYHSGNKPSLATLGFTGASNANYITNNNQLTNGANYITTSAIGTYIGKGRPNNYVASSTSTSNRGNFGEGIWAYSGYSTGTNRPFTYDATLQVMPDTSLGFELSIDWLSQSSTPIKIRSLRDCCQGWSSYSTIWTSSTDGSGSGLDADLLDGYNSAENGANTIHRLASNGYSQIQNWQNVAGTGIYSTTVNGAHFTPNQTTSYGTWKTTGSRGGYDGIVFDSGGDVAVMFDSAGNGGFYREANGRWMNYHHISNACTGFNASTTSSAYTIYVTGAIYATQDVVAYSDRRIKENIITIDSALEKVNKLRGVYYNKIDNEDKEREIGFIAQEVNEVAPELVTYAEDVDQYGVKYGNTTALLVEAVKELTQQVKDLKQEIEEMKNVK